MAWFHCTGYNGRNERMPQEKLHRRRGQGHVVAMADFLDTPGFFQDLGRGGVIGIARTFGWAGHKDAGGEDRADDDAHVALFAQRKFFVEDLLVQQSIGHGDDAKVEVDRVE